MLIVKLYLESTEEALEDLVVHCLHLTVVVESSLFYGLNDLCYLLPKPLEVFLDLEFKFQNL